MINQVPRVVGKKLTNTKQIGPKAKALKDGLTKLVVGQSEAIDSIVNMFQMSDAKLTPSNRPIGSFLFLGPTGTGKTRLVEAVAETLVGTPKGLIKIDCAEFQHSHEIAKLIGSPPGYLGHRETSALLSQSVLNAHHTDSCKISFVLFDEIEKASDALYNLLLGVLDKASLTLGTNSRVDFSKTMIFMTSNLGAQELAKLAAQKFGYTGPGDVQMTDDKVSRITTEALRKKFLPEFINRIDKIVNFSTLSNDQYAKILDIELAQFQDRILTAATEENHGDPYYLRYTDEAKKILLREGIDPKYGARPLKRAINVFLIQPLSNLISNGEVKGGDIILVDKETDDELCFIKEVENMTGLYLFELHNRDLRSRSMPS